MVWARIAVIGAAVFLFGSHVATARADIINSFTASGLFDNGATLSGYINIDVTSGHVVDGSLVVGAPVSLTFGILNDEGYQPAYGDPVFGAFVSKALSDQIAVAINAASLVGYAGGSLASEDMGTPTGAASAIFYNYGNNGSHSSSELVQGAFTLVPEPGSLALVGAGLLGLCAMRRARKPNRHMT